MPKMKTKRALKKRFKVTKTGKVKRTKANRGHLMSGEPGKVRRKRRKPGLCHPTEAKRVKEAFGKQKK